ncbi:hypothetical protein ACHWGL_32740, partial [Klebsiella pneumoniae]|uniref:hypothetical protein n=1 Tax=Klebsiella pneumoniae TaxID=573 RepID=UPI00376ED62D
FTVSVTAANNYGTSSAAVSDGTINDGIDYSQQWMTTQNNPSKLPPVDITAIPVYGKLAPANKNSLISNVFAMDFTPGV